MLNIVSGGLSAAGLGLNGAVMASISMFFHLAAALICFGGSVVLVLGVASNGDWTGSTSKGLG